MENKNFKCPYCGGKMTNKGYYDENEFYCRYCDIRSNRKAKEFLMRGRQYYGSETEGTTLKKNVSRLAGVYVPYGVETIGKEAFADDTSVWTVKIPTGVTRIEDEAFRNCSWMWGVSLPNSVKSIGCKAFVGCRSLSQIKFRGTVLQWNKIAKGEGWDSDTGNYTVYCKNGTIKKPLS